MPILIYFNGEWAYVRWIALRGRSLTVLCSLRCFSVEKLLAIAGARLLEGGAL